MQSQLALCILEIMSQDSAPSDGEIESGVVVRNESAVIDLTIDTDDEAPGSGVKKTVFSVNVKIEKTEGKSEEKQAPVTPLVQGGNRFISPGTSERSSPWAGQPVRTASVPFSRLVIPNVGDLECGGGGGCGDEEKKKAEVKKPQKKYISDERAKVLAAQPKWYDDKTIGDFKRAECDKCVLE